MTFMNSIIQFLNDLSTYCYNIYAEVLGWIDPFWRLSTLFYLMSNTFNSLAWQFYYFSDWINNATYQMSLILDWSTIWSLIQSYAPNLSLVGQWFTEWWVDVWDVMTSWWGNTQSVVQSWIEDVKLWAGVQINQLSTWFVDLEGEWNSFTTSTLPNLADWSGVESLISSQLASFTPFLEGWQDWRDKVTEFFTDPEDWLYKAIDRIIERYW